VPDANYRISAENDVGTSDWPAAVIASERGCDPSRSGLFVADFSGGLIHINSAQRKPYHTA